MPLSSKLSRWCYIICHYYYCYLQTYMLSIEYNYKLCPSSKNTQRSSHSSWYGEMFLDTLVISAWFNVVPQSDHLPIVAGTIYENLYCVKWQIYSTVLKAPDLRCDIYCGSEYLQICVWKSTHLKHTVSSLSRISLLNHIIVNLLCQISSSLNTKHYIKSQWFQCWTILPLLLLDFMSWIENRV